MEASIYQIDSGRIIGRVVAPPDHISVQCQEGEEFYLNCPSEATHIINNEPVTIAPPPPPPPTESEIIASLTAAVQQHLDTTARTRNYDGILSLCTYATSLDPTFKCEGQAGVEWRDSVWRTSYQIMAEVKVGTRATPGSEELLSLLPEIVWPMQLA